MPKSGGGTHELAFRRWWTDSYNRRTCRCCSLGGDPGFSESSYGFRPGQRGHDAVRAAKQYIERGHRYVVDVDLEIFFDRVNHNVLMGRLGSESKIGEC